MDDSGRGTTKRDKEPRQSHRERGPVNDNTVTRGTQSESQWSRSPRSLLLGAPLVGRTEGHISSSLVVPCWFCTYQSLQWLPHRVLRAIRSGALDLRPVSVPSGPSSLSDPNPQRPVSRQSGRDHPDQVIGGLRSWEVDSQVLSREYTGVTVIGGSRRIGRDV